MLYRLPQPEDEALLKAYMQEHYDHSEASISASLGLPACEYAAWVEKIHRNASTGDEHWGRSLLYLCFDQGRLIGLVSIRYALPEALSESIGDVGYGVRPSERNKGYATMMLRHALNVCREQGMTRVTLGCYRDNLASVRVILKNGGVLTAESDNYSPGRISQYYRIDL